MTSLNTSHAYSLFRIPRKSEANFSLLLATDPAPLFSFETNLTKFQGTSRSNSHISHSMTYRSTIMSSNPQKQLKKLNEDLAHVNNKLKKYERERAVLNYKIGQWKTIQRLVQDDIVAKEREIANAAQMSHREAFAIEGQIYAPASMSSSVIRPHWKICPRCGKSFLCDKCWINECRLCLMRPETPPPPYEECYFI